MSKRAAEMGIDDQDSDSDNSVNLSSSDYNSSDDDLSESNGDSDEEVEYLSNVRVWYETDTDSIPPAPPHFQFTATPAVNVILDENATPQYFSTAN